MAIVKITINKNGLNLALRDLADINYFVGVNGSGKTRLCKSIKSHNDNLKSKIFDPEIKLESSSGFGTWGYLDFDINSLVRQKISMSFGVQLEKNPIIQSILNLFYLDASLLCNPSAGLSIRIDGDIFDIDDCATGMVGLLKLFLSAYTNQPVNYEIKEKGLLYISTIDEVDCHLHPTVTKDFPGILENIRSNIIAEYKKYGVDCDLVFFVTTHSPFLISALATQTKDFSHKVFLLKSGKTQDLRGGLSTPESESGYTAGQALLCANQMLGTQLDDLMPYFILLAENSVHELLAAISKKFPERFKIKYFRYDTSGDGDTIKQARLLVEQRKAIPFLNSRVVALFDGVLEGARAFDEFIMYMGSETDSDLESLYPEDIVRVFTQEKGYPDWVKAEETKRFNAYLANSAKIVCHEKKGVLKKELALFFVEKVDSFDDICSLLPALRRLIKF